jgi:putative spermidine/putrescine transport system permease protein
MTAPIDTTSRQLPRRLGRLGPYVVLLCAALFFSLPMLAMARTVLQNVPAFLLNTDTLFDKWSFREMYRAFEEPDFRTALWLSLQLALGTVALTLGLLLPTAVWTHLRVPRARPIIEFLTVLPYVIPAIALVAGIKVIQPHARWFLNSEYSLIPFYTVLALPFTYRSLDAGIRAIDLRTLVDASRSLGAGWGITLRRALIPNLRTAIISSAFLTTAVVLGEFTIANVLLRDTLPTFMQFYRGPEPRAAYGLALLTLVATTLLFALLTVLTRGRGSRAPVTLAVAGAPAPIANPDTAD